MRVTDDGDGVPGNVLRVCRNLCADRLTSLLQDNLKAVFIPLIHFFSFAFLSAGACPIQTGSRTKLCAAATAAPEGLISTVALRYRTSYRVTSQSTRQDGDAEP